MIQRCIPRLAQTLKQFCSCQQRQERFLQFDFFAIQKEAGPGEKVTNGVDRSFRLFSTSGLTRNPCRNNNGCRQQEPEECTITPCCRPFRLQKEHPMKKKKSEDKCERNQTGKSEQQK